MMQSNDILLGNTALLYLMGDCESGSYYIFTESLGSLGYKWFINH